MTDPVTPALAPLDLLARLRDYHDQVLKGFRHISRVEEADLIQAAIDGLRQKVWLEMDTAPQDGSWYLGWNSDCGCFIWRDGPGLITGEDPAPTHWMPLPTAPAHPVPQQADFWCCKTCGCLWRDNHDGTVSLASMKQTSCEACERLTAEPTCEALRRAARLTSKAWHDGNEQAWNDLAADGGLPESKGEQ